jgi:hypothetical protein
MGRISNNPSRIRGIPPCGRISNNQGGMRSGEEYPMSVPHSRDPALRENIQCPRVNEKRGRISNVRPAFAGSRPAGEYPITRPAFAGSRPAGEYPITRPAFAGSRPAGEYPISKGEWEAGKRGKISNVRPAFAGSRPAGECPITKGKLKEKRKSNIQCPSRIRGIPPCGRISNIQVKTKGE